MIRKILISALALLCMVSAGAADYRFDSAAHVHADALALSAAGKKYMSVTVRPFGSGHSVVVLCSEEGGRWKEEKAVLENAAGGMLWLAPDGKFRLFFCREGKAMMAEMQGDVSGWKKPVAIGEGRPTGTPLSAGDALWMLPVLGENGPKVFRSSDAGRTWTSAGGPSSRGYEASACEAKLYPTQAGTLALVMRTLGTTYAYVSFSSDLGSSWTAPRVFCHNPNLGLEVKALPGGEVLFVKNARYDNAKYNIARGLYAYLTPDNGALWHGGLMLDAREGVHDPCVLLQDGRIVCAYTYEKDGYNSICLTETTRDEIARAWGSYDKPAQTAPAELFRAGRSEDALAGQYAPLMKKHTVFKGETLKIATYNIEWQGYVKACSWDERIKSIKVLFDEYGFDLVGTQEPDVPMMEQLMLSLKGYEAIWLVPENYKGKGFIAINPIIYRKERLELIGQGVFYFSDTESPSIVGWDSWGKGRNCHWARFRDRHTGKELCIFNSHVDHRGLEAKEYSPLLLQKKILEIAPDCAVFCTGDFNFTEETPGYKRMVECPWISDSMTSLPERKRENWEYFSMANFKPLSSVPKSRLHLDHIFYTHNNSRVLSWKLITDAPDGVYGSDHLPITVEWQIAE